MKTEIIKIDLQRADASGMERAGKRIADGELVAFPTETVYGLGGNALDPGAAQKIYAAKGRPSDNPLIVHIAEFSDVERIAEPIPREAKLLADAFWPGPLTMILHKKDTVPDATTGGLDTVAIRMPDHPVALELIRRSGCLIAAPSANTSGRPSPTEAAHVAADLDGRIAMILDGGAVGIGIESTIVDLTGEIPAILRPGYITKKMLEEALGREVMTDPGILAADGGAKPKAPGMKYRHYAPKADMVLFDGERERVVEEINRRTAQQRAAGKKVAVLAAEETGDCYRADFVLRVGARTDEDAIARQIYRLLRECDRLGADVIYSECFSTPRLGNAIMNRLQKAAAHRIVRV